MKKIEAIKIFVQNPISAIIQGIQAKRKDFYKNQVSKNHGLSKLPTIDILDLFPQFEETVSYYSFLPGTSPILDHALLKAFARKFDNCSYMEIGTLRGESIANVAEVTEDCLSITLGSEEMRQRGYSNKLISQLGFFLKDNKKIKSLDQDSTKFDFTSLGKKFDLIFVDGDHSYHGVLNDTKKVFSLRKNEKSIIVWHDYSDNYEDVGYEVLSGILDGVPKDKQKNLYHVSNTLCAVYIEDNQLKTSYTESYSMPNKNFTIKLSGKPC
jgi:hypothetical protein